MSGSDNTQGFQTKLIDLEASREQHIIIWCLLLQYLSEQISGSQKQIESSWHGLLSWKWGTSERSSSRRCWRRSWPTIAHFQFNRSRPRGKMKWLFFLTCSMSSLTKQMRALILLGAATQFWTNLLGPRGPLIEPLIPSTHPYIFFFCGFWSTRIMLFPLSVRPLRVSQAWHLNFPR